MAVLSAVSGKFVAMALSKELAGSYNSAYGYLQLFAILADFGLYAVSVREVSRTKDKERVLGTLITLRCLITLLSLGSAIVIAWLVPMWNGTPLPLSVTIVAFVPFFTLLAGVLRTVFQVTYKMHYVFIAEVLQRVLTVGLMFVAILMGIRLSENLAVLHGFLWIGVASAFLLFILSVIFATRLMTIRPVFDPALLRSLFRSAVPYGAAFLCIALYRQSDLTMIALLRPDFALQNAPYGFANRVVEMTYLVPTFLLNSTLPVLSERSSRGESTAKLLGQTLLAILALGTISSLFSFFWARPLMEILTTELYLGTPGHPGADTALQYLSAPMFFNGIVLFSFYVLLTKHRWRPLVLTMLAGVVISITLNLLWIPSDGFMGAIRTSTVVQFFLAVTLLPQALRTMPVLLQPRHVVTLVLSAALLGVILALTAHLPVLTLIVLSGVVGLLGLAILLSLLNGKRFTIRL